MVIKIKNDIMKTEVILTTTEMKGKDIVNAPFWNSEHIYHKEDVTEEMLRNGKQWYEYHVKFSSLTPLFISKTNKLKKPLQAK